MDMFLRRKRNENDDDENDDVVTAASLSDTFDAREELLLEQDVSLISDSLVPSQVASFYAINAIQIEDAPLRAERKKFAVALR